MNKELLYVDFKSVRLDRVLTNLFIKMYADGQPVQLAFRKEYTIDTLKSNLNTLEEQGVIKGVKDNPDGVEDWLRSSLLELVNRGNVIKEHVSTLKPLHLLSFRVQNSKYCRDYRASDQLYLMLKSNPEVMKGLVKYLSKGWDKASGEINTQEDLDVDTTGILHITKPLRERKSMNKDVDVIPKPLLEKQASLFTDDVRRLLLYKEKLPRAVFIDYLRILCGLHLALYTMKVVYLLPKMVDAGTRNVTDDWSMVVDLTDNLDSIVSQYACKDIERMENSYGKYIRATYMVDIIQKRKRCDVDEAFSRKITISRENTMRRNSMILRTVFQTATRRSLTRTTSMKCWSSSPRKTTSTCLCMFSKNLIWEPVSISTFMISLMPSA